jgi:hypothetical protein
MATNMHERREQISVPVDSDLRAAIERAAEAEHRSVAGQIRHWIANGLANQAADNRVAA